MQDLFLFSAFGRLKETQFHYLIFMKKSRLKKTFADHMEPVILIAISLNESPYARPKNGASDFLNQGIPPLIFLQAI